MRNRLTPGITLSLGVLLALSSVISTARMAPSRATVQLEAYTMVYGALIDGFCGGEPGQDHHCPLCHGLPDVPCCAQEERLVILEPHDAWRRGEDLLRAARARNLRHSPRAPPAVV